MALSNSLQPILTSSGCLGRLSTAPFPLDEDCGSSSRRCSGMKLTMSSSPSSPRVSPLSTRIKACTAGGRADRRTAPRTVLRCPLSCGLRPGSPSASVSRDPGLLMHYSSCTAAVSVGNGGGELPPIAPSSAPDLAYPDVGRNRPEIEPSPPRVASASPYPPRVKSSLNTGHALGES